MHKKIIGLTAAGFLAGAAASAQISETDNVKKNLSYESKDTVAWTRRGLFQIGLNQGFLHNWAAGGEVASLQADALFSGNITRLYHKTVWSNTLDANYSLFYAYSNRFVPRKVDDRVDFTSKFGSRIDTSNFFITGIFNFKSQFTKGFDYSVPEWDTFSTSNRFSPAYLTLGAGMEYRRGAALSLFFSPAAARVTLASKYYTSRRPEGAFGIEYNKKARFELGAYFSGRYQHEFSKNISYKTRVDLYANYLAKDKKDSLGVVVAKDNPGNIDILWDNLVQVKLGKYFALTLALTMIYDNDIPYSRNYMDGSGALVDKDEPGTSFGWWQMKQVMNLGFIYKF
jgi:hypothetical protein